MVLPAPDPATRTVCSPPCFHFPESIAPAKAELLEWRKDGSLVMDEEILEGIERYPEALQFMFSGGNIGKLLVKAG